MRTLTLDLIEMAELSRIPGPLSLETRNMAENWRRFIQQFEIYLVAYEKTRKPEKTKVNMFLNAAGPRAFEVFNTFQFKDGNSPESFADACERANFVD